MRMLAASCSRRRGAADSSLTVSSTCKTWRMSAVGSQADMSKSNSRITYHNGFTAWSESTRLTSTNAVWLEGFENMHRCKLA